MRPGTLSAQQRRLFDRLLDQRGVGAGVGRIPRYAGDRTAMPTSFAQQRIWFFDRLQPAETIYNVAGAARLTGRLDVAVLERCLTEVVRRHEVLRTTYAAVDNRPVQRVNPPVPVVLPVTDLRDLPADERDAAVRERCDVEVKRPFDLERGPMLRPMLMRLADDEHLLLMSQHHIATDGWSLNVLMREVSALYAALRAGQPSPLAELTVQYGDFAAWQREWLAGDVLDRQLAYWRERLADSRLVDVSTGLPRPTALTWVGGTLRYHLDADVVRGLTALAESERATTYMALVAAQSVVLSRWSGQDDVVVGCPVANRNRAETADLIGCFVNELPLRMNTAGTPTYRELLRQAREVCLGAYANQDVPFEKVVEAVNPERDAMSHAPLVRHQLGLHNEPQWRVELPELTFEIAALSTGTARFDLEVDLSPDPSGAITGMVYFSTDLYTDDVVRRLLDSLTAVITAAVADPDTPAWRLPVVGPDERARLTALGAPAPAGVDVAVLAGAGTVDALVAGQAARLPRAVAIVDGSTTVTYRELDDRANRLAHWLRHLGVGAGTPVPVCLPPSAWQATAVLAVLKAGGAAVPVDPDHPAAAVHAAVRATGARLVLTDSATVLDESVRLEALDSAVRVLALDTVTDRIDGYPATRPDPVTGPDGLAFLTVALGEGPDRMSTVVTESHTHAAVTRRLTWLATAFGPSVGGAVHLGGHTDLDAGAWAPLWPVASGGQLVLTDEVPRPDVLCCGVAELAQRLQAPAAARLAPRQILLDGEQPWPALLADLQRIWPGTATAVLCGAIGTAADLVAVPVRPGSDRSGRPIAGAPLDIVDAHGQPVPAGVPGELRLGADLRTGLRARWLPDDGLEVLGPVAEATTIRRHRVELTEVVGVIEGHAEIERAVVLAVAPEASTAPELSTAPAAACALAAPPADPEHRADPELVAYVTLRGRAAGEDEVSRERRLFETAYTGRAAEDDPVLNIAGWNSPQTGEHITAGEMREWSDATMRRILRLAPQHVLEIGCRTGPLLFRLAPRCESYTATDLSARALGRVRRHGDWLAKKADSVQLLKRGVDDFSGFGPDRFDTVVLDALVQYFPTVGFLERVLRGAVGVVRPGGHIFLGNVRSLPLLPAMHLSVKWAQEPPGTSARQLRRLVTQAAAAEEELVCDPRLFTDLAARIPGVTGVWILPRAGRIRNELTLYRYDVVLSVGGESVPDTGTGGDERDWRADGLTPDAVRGLLAGRASGPLVLRDMPDSRLAGKLDALDLLDRGAVATVGELSESGRPAAVSPGGPADPAELAAVAADAGYDTYVRQSLGAAGVGLVDLVLTPHDPMAVGAPLPAPYAPRLLADPVTLANDPVRAARRRTAVTALRGHALERLPGYLVPAHVVVLDTWPLDRSGRLDRTALPRPAAKAAADLAAREPRTDTERAIAKIWADALGLDTIGVHDDFFSLGGHSLLGAEVVEQVREVYEVDLPLGRLFEAPTVAAVAEYVDRALAAPAAPVVAGGIERIDRGDYRTRRARAVSATGGRS